MGNAEDVCACCACFGICGICCVAAAEEDKREREQAHHQRHSYATHAQIVTPVAIPYVKSGRKPRAKKTQANGKKRNNPLAHNGKVYKENISTNVRKITIEKLSQ